ncbi:MAG: hypothetical protein P8R46_04040 [Planctomycetota bacterium]|nr:hypothetical protein [Planctomycetota bacterium]
MDRPSAIIADLEWMKGGRGWVNEEFRLGDHTLHRETKEPRR